MDGLLGGQIEHNRRLNHVGFFANRGSPNMVVASDNHERLVSRQAHTQSTDSISNGVSAGHVMNPNRWQVRRPTNRCRYRGDHNFNRNIEMVTKRGDTFKQLARTDAGVSAGTASVDDGRHAWLVQKVSHCLGCVGNKISWQDRAFTRGGRFRNKGRFLGLIVCDLVQSVERDERDRIDIYGHVRFGCQRCGGKPLLSHRD